MRRHGYDEPLRAIPSHISHMKKTSSVIDVAGVDSGTSWWERVVQEFYVSGIDRCPVTQKQQGGEDG